MMLKTFDVDYHKKNYINYLEVLVDSKGTINYAVPSHQELAIKRATENTGCKDRDEFHEFISIHPYHMSHYHEFLLLLSKSVYVWNKIYNGYINPNILETLENLKEEELFENDLNSVAIGNNNSRLRRIFNMLIDSAPEGRGFNS